MKRFLFLFVFLFPILTFATAPAVTVFPDTVMQGEPVMIVIENVSDMSAVSKIYFDGKIADLFWYQGKPTALIGIDLNKKPGNYKVVVNLADGSTISKIISVDDRPRVSAPLGIPEKLGGNTPVAVRHVVNTLWLENRAIYSVRTFPRALWTGKFIIPVPNHYVTDTYGYSRQTGGQSITHKGTDFRATTGTPVVAMNRGIVRLARTYQIYGKTIIVDHGGGLMTLYMHLSKILVNEGELVKQDQIIARSGQTGYAEGPHLHVSVWIDKVSVDPMRFMALFK